MKRSIITSLFFIIFASATKAQNINLGTWIGLGYEQKLKIKDFKFNAEIEQQLRVSNILYNTEARANTEVGVSKKLTDFYKLGVSYRISYIGDLKHRASISNTFKYEKDKIELSARLKYQAEFQKNTPFSQDFRLKANLLYQANKDYRPYVFGEILYNNTYNFSNFNEYRVGLGLDTDYKKEHQFDINIFYIGMLNQENPTSKLVLALSYKLSR